MYLGRLLNLTNAHDTELKNRIAKAWKKYFVYRSELTCKYYPLGDRMKLFTSVVQPTLLYGCECWTMNRKREEDIRSVQRRMLRSILGNNRKVTYDDSGERVLEDWVAWIRRATKEAEKSAREYGCPDWVEEITRRKYRWAGHVARREDGRWTREVLDLTLSGSRAANRPHIRWSDSLNQFFYGAAVAAVGFGSWTQKAQNREEWQHAEEDYVRFCMRR